MSLAQAAIASEAGIAYDAMFLVQRVFHNVLHVT